MTSLHLILSQDEFVPVDVFYPRAAGLPAMALRLYLSVCACLSQVGVLLKRFYMEVRRGIWDHSLLLPICPADGHYALVAPVI